MRKLILGSGLSLVVLGGAMAAQAQTDKKSDDNSKNTVKTQDSSATDPTSKSPQIKYDGIDGQAPERTKGFVKFDGVDGEATDSKSWKVNEMDGKGNDAAGKSSTTSGGPYLKIDTIPGESKARATPFLKLGDIKGESSDHANKSGGNVETTWKVEEGEKAASPFIKFDGVEGEALDRSQDWKVEEGAKGAAPDEAMPNFKVEINGAAAAAEEKPDGKRSK